jgi:lipopolysaccharide biosynthesis regulator YciM
VLAWRRRRRRAPAPQGGAAGRVRVALSAVLAGDRAAAERALAEAARLDSGDVDVYLALASLYRARGEIGRAIQIHQNLLLRDDLPEPLRRECRESLAQDFRAGGFLARASAAFEEILESEPRNLRALAELERIRVETGDFEGALRARRRIGSADPRTPRVLAHLLVGLGRAHERDGQPRAAARCYRKAIARDAGCAEAYLALADQRVAAGKPRQAIDLLRRALPLHRALGPLVWPKLFACHQTGGDLAGFERLARARLAEDAEDAEASLWLARALARTHRLEEALAALRLLLDRHPGYLPAHAELGRALLGEQRQLEALKVFEELLERLPGERPRLRCRACGTEDDRLHFRCPQCGEWDGYA